jgi:hypothetical protein
MFALVRSVSTHEYVLVSFVAIHIYTKKCNRFVDMLRMNSHQSTLHNSAGDIELLNNPQTYYLEGQSQLYVIHPAW